MAGTVGLSTMTSYASNQSDLNADARLPREVWIGAVSQMNLRADNVQMMNEQVGDIITNMAVYRPDIICLPELFYTSNVSQVPPLSELEDVSQKTLTYFSAIAKELHCYLICGVHTFENGKSYNSAVLLDRDGQYVGEYRKTHTTEGEVKAGLTPGPMEPPVFETDFGTIGIQICFDVEWDESWKNLRAAGAEMVFWPSAFAGGQILNSKAWRHKYVVVSSTRKNTAKICDIDGQEISKTGIWNRNFVCAPVNLEKVFLHTWPYVRYFQDIRNKYGRKVRITTFDEEEWSIIESLDASVFVSDIMKEFDMKSHESHLKHAQMLQDQARIG
ncbi:MAG: carbon-nitrogen hydrolase family protein [Saprospiraceae bacterium]|nr:carbon-nitrogen hydrolase family protein [Saprospiraceae bacterium]